MNFARHHQAEEPLRSNLHLIGLETDPVFIPFKVVGTLRVLSAHKNKEFFYERHKTIR